MGQVSGGPEGHDLTRAKPVCSRHILVRPAFKMRVYLGRIVELDREPTYEVGPKLAIYRSAATPPDTWGARILGHGESNARVGSTCTWND